MADRRAPPMARARDADTLYDSRMVAGITIEFADAIGDAGSRPVYELAATQFDRYRAPIHRYLVLDTSPVEPDWLPITERIGAPDPCETCALLPTFTRPYPGRLDELDRWYTHHHVPEVTTVAGFIAGQRFAHRDADAEHPRLALYELDTEDPGAALERLTAALPTMVQTGALDGSSIASWLYLPVR